MTGRRVGSWLAALLASMLASGLGNARAQTSAQGIELEFCQQHGGEPSVCDARRSRLIALYVPAEQPASPFLTAGAFEATFRGAVGLPLNDDRIFVARGRGSFELRLAGEVVLESAADGDFDLRSRMTQLRKGDNPIELRYRSPSTGDAELRLSWQGEVVPLEPVPPESLRHRSDSKRLLAGAELRRGRQLVAEARCVLCHRTELTGRGSMPELHDGAPELEALGERLRPQWLVRWLQRPTGVRAATEMPAVLHGSAEQREQMARDLAAFLVDGTDQRWRRRALKRRFAPKAAERGEALYAQLGCAVCHLAGDEPALLPLADLRAKYWPQALVDYLIEPASHDRWTLMPDFRLSGEEAEALAAYLWQRSSPTASASAELGSSARGGQLFRELRCAACHETRGAPQELAALPALEQVAKSIGTVDGGAGCLSAERAAGDPRPSYDFDDEQRAAVHAVLAEPTIASLGRTSLAELAERQYQRLQCQACHQRDGSGDRWSVRLAAARPAVTFETASRQDETVYLARPPLTWAGEKLNRAWLSRFLAGTLPYKPRAQLMARMPGFSAHAEGIAAGMVLQHGFSTAPPPPETAVADLAAVGRELVQMDRLGCFACHGLGDEPALGTEAAQETINFRHVTERLRREFYDRFLLDPQRVLPGSMMPSFVDERGRSSITDIEGGDARRQFDAIWHLMLELAELR